MMRVGIATRLRRFGLKLELVVELRSAGHEVVDFGADNLNSTDVHSAVSLSGPQRRKLENHAAELHFSLRDSS
jgi:hypothetical protein